MHYAKDIQCKASVTGDLILLGNCSQASLFMAIFVFSVPKSLKVGHFISEAKKKNKKKLLTSVTNLLTLSAVSTLRTSRFHVTRTAVFYLTLCGDVLPTTCETNGLLEL